MATRENTKTLKTPLSLSFLKNGGFFSFFWSQLLAGWVLLGDGSGLGGF